MSIRFIFAILLASLVLSFTNACKCKGDLTFEEKFDEAENVDALYIYGRIHVRDGKFDRFVDSNIPAVDDISNTHEDTIHYLAYRWKSFKGCSGPTRQTTVLNTASYSAACGVSLEKGWYVLGSTTDDSQTPRQQHIYSCGLIQPWKSLTYEEYKYAMDNSEIRSLYIDECT